MAGQNYGHTLFSHSLQQQAHPNNSQPIYSPTKHIASPTKHAAFPTDQNHAKWENLPYEPPSKRMKLESVSPGLTFVSQTKWKFSNSQQWPKVQQAGSKARNAAQAPREHTTKAYIEQQLPHTARAPHSLQAVITQNAGLSAQPVLPQRAQNDERQSPVMTKRSDNRARSDEAARFQETHSDHRIAHCESKQSEPISPLSKLYTSKPEVPDEICRLNALSDSSSQWDHGTPRTSTSLVIGPIKVIPKSKSTSGKGLSLERDSDRIAALIAEKRKANEANMFRQRLHQMQIEHQKEKGLAKTAPAKLDHANIMESKEFDSKQSVHDDSFQNSPNGESTVPSAKSHRDEKGVWSKNHPGSLGGSLSNGTHTAEVQTNEAAHFVGGGQVLDTYISRNQAQQKMGVSESAIKTYGRPKTANLKSDIDHASTEAFRNNYTTSSTLLNKATTPHDFTTTGPVRNGNINSAHVNGSASTNSNSSAAITAQIVATTDNMIASSNETHTVKESDTATMNGSRRNQHLWSSSQLLPNNQHHHIPKASQKQTLLAQPSHTSSPSSFQYEPSHGSVVAPLSTQANAVDINQSVVHYPQARPQSRMIPTLHANGTAPTYYNINQNFYLGPGPVNTSHSNFTTLPPPPTRPNISMGFLKSTTSPTRNVDSPPYAHSPQNPVQNNYSPHNHATLRSLPQPPTLTSNMNMFSGQARAPSNIGTKTDATRKERVNMFMRGNGTSGHSPVGPGMIMGMEEIRRGIEMT